MDIEKTTGLIAAPYVPFDQKGRVNTGIIAEYAAFLKQRNLKGVFINGSTGESASLSVAERNEVTREWAKYQEKDFKIFVHVGTNSIEDSASMAKTAADLGVFANSSTGPGYFRPQSPQALVSFLASIASAAPEIPFYYYHIPALNHNFLSPVEILTLATSQIPNFAGMKYTFEDLMELQLCTSVSDGKLDILYGRDETLLCGLALGLSGGVGSTYNFMPDLYYRLISEFKSGHLDKSRELQLQAVRVIQIYSRYYGIPAGKVIMKELGLDMGEPRLPFLSLTKSQKEILIGELKELNFFS